MNVTNCAALELCLCKTLPVTSTHRCPACQKCVHAICGETCEDASIQYHTTCFKCFATYNATFKDPDDFRGTLDAMRMLAMQNPQPEGEVLDPDDDKEIKNLLESAIAVSEQQSSPRVVSSSSIIIKLL